ncbi:MAG: acyltransferase, partial [Lachnospiraceae bacterium]|nr:acyltransferase [Lachnospiraceae bacterium]
MSKRYISTNILKAISICFVIFQHSLQTNSNVHYQEVYKNLGFSFWLLQAVSIFVIITGFHYAMSIEKLEKEVDWYRKDAFRKKLERIVFPYSFAFLCYLFYVLAVEKGKMSLNTLFVYLKGGAGPGGYYTWVLVQFLVIFPVIYHIVKKSLLYGSMLVISINMLYEYAVFQGVIRSSFNRLCCVRLLTGLLLGIAIYRYTDE